MVRYQVWLGSTLLLAGYVLVVCGIHAPARGAKEPVKAEGAAEVPEELRDPAFHRYVDIRRLAAALETQDPAALADVAIRLAEGERAVGRAHKGISAEAALRLAVRLAAEKHDTKTLDRLADAVKARGDAKLAGMLALAQQLARAPRKADPSMVVAADQTTPEAMTLYRSLLGEVQQAKVLSDREALDQLQQSVDVLTELHEKQRAYLAKLIADSRSTLPPKADRESAMLRKLAALSRKTPPAAATTDRARIQTELKKGWVGIAFAKMEYRTVAQAAQALKKHPLAPPPTALAQKGIAVYRHFPPCASAGQVAYYTYEPFVRWKTGR